MREIKFRAWDKAQKCLILPDMALNEFVFGINFKKITHPDNLILLQFVGFKDKKGEEIYEGDVVENYALKDEVIFDNGIFTTKNSSWDKFGCKQPLAVHNELEVIGNIYKNPELLK